METNSAVTRVRISNYKSIARCDVRLGRMAFLVGANGSGKSNFVDALRFVADSLNTSLDHALSERGGIHEICHRSSPPQTDFGLALELVDARGRPCRFAVLVAAEAGGGYSVRREECVVEPAAGEPRAHYRLDCGEIVSTSAAVTPAAAGDRLFLVHASGLPEFRPVYDTLSRLGLYNMNPQVIRDLQSANGTAQLARDGGNLAAVFQRLAVETPAVKGRIEEYLGKIVPGIRSVEVLALGPKLTLEFRQDVSGAGKPVSPGGEPTTRPFLAASMSDGTLRAFAILVALHPSLHGNASLIGIEEPEVALHPAAAGVVLDSLLEASYRSQLVLTTHSPELLDDEKLTPEVIFPVVLGEGRTWIGTLDEFGANALRDRVATAGELLRLNQVTMDLPAVRDSVRELRLFDEE